MKTLRLLIAALALAPLSALAQNQNVTQQIATKRVNSDVVIGSGRAFTVEAGGSITISPGATTSGILSNASLAGLPTGIATITTGTGAINTLSNSAGVSAVISDETGTGALVFGTSPAFTTNFTFANGATPSTTTVAQVAFDTDAWAASRGALQIYDGTDNTYVVAVLASDTPTNGQFPRWNTGGTITWETPGSGSGDVVGPGSSTDNALTRFDSTTGKLIQNSTTTLSDAGAFAFADDVEQVFNPGSTNAGLNVGSISGDPSAPSNGALWYDSASNELTARINGSNVALGAGGGGGVGGSTGSTDNALLRADGTGGATLQSSALTIDDAGALTVPEISAPSTPASAKVVIYAKSDGRVYSKDDAGTESALGVAGAGTGDVVGPGSSTDNALARFDSTSGVLLQNSTTTLSDAGAFAFADDVEQVFNPGSTNAGLNVGSITGDPSAPSNGALWYDSTANELTARINGANVALGSGGGGGIGGSTGATDNRILRADGTGGSTLQNSGASIDDSGNVTANSYRIAVGEPAGNATAFFALNYVGGGRTNLITNAHNDGENDGNEISIWLNTGSSGTPNYTPGGSTKRAVRFGPVTTSFYSTSSGTTTEIATIGAAGFYLRVPIIPRTSALTLTVEQSGATFTNEGAGAQVVLTLPPAVAGLAFTGVVQDADGLRFTAASGDTIRIAGTVSGAAGYVEAATIGNTITLQSINATEWIAVAVNGTWTFSP